MRFTSRTLLLLCLAPITAALGLLHPSFLIFSWVWPVFLIGLAVLDLICARRVPLSITRTLPDSLTQGVKAKIILKVKNLSTDSFRLGIVDQPPLEFNVSSCFLQTRCPPGTLSTLQYEVQSQERGEFEWKNLYYWVEGPLGLARHIRQGQSGVPTQLRVFPKLHAESGVQLEATRRKQAMLGQKWIRRLGEGREFESLRNYTRDDDYRWIDWKGVAKHNRLIVRQYQAERNQRVLILLDAGRFMLSKVGDLTKLDYAIEAALSLTRLAIQHGDMVGILVFDSEIRGWIAPHRSSQLLPQMSDLLRKIKGQRLESNYALACAQAARRSTRRTLMVCFTEVHEHATLLVRAMSSLYPRHLPLCVTMADADLYRASFQVPNTPSEAYHVTAAVELWENYQQTLRLLEGWKVLTVHALADSYCSSLLDRYLNIKGRGLL